MSNLTVSYVSQTPAANPAGTTTAAPAADSPLGFLAALIDQLLAGGAEATGTSTEAGASANVPGLLDLDFGSTTEINPQKSELRSDLVGAITAHLDQFEAGSPDAPSPDQSPDLRQAIDALIAALDAAPQPPAAAADSAPTIPTEHVNKLLADLGLIAPAATAAPPAATATVAAPPTDIAALRDRLLALSQSVAATSPDLAQKLQTLVSKLEPIAADPELAAQFGLDTPSVDPDALTIAQIVRSLLGHSGETGDTDPEQPSATASQASQLQDDMLQLLATLGLGTAPAVTTTPAAATPTATTATTAVPPDLLRLSTQLGQVATALSASAPDLAKKLEAVATRLVSADADPALLAKLTGAAGEPDGTALDKLVQSLVDAKPATTSVPVAPQIAAPKDLALPAPVAPKQSKSAVTEVKAAPPEPAPVTADSAPAPTTRVTLAATAPATDPSPEPKVEAKVAAIVADATKADPATQPATAQPQQPAPAAQTARALPAAYQTTANPINMGQMAFEMVRQVHQGTSRFTIRLDPPELGRVDVKMHVDAQGALNARLTVDRAETLDLFQRDRQSLERALSQAGLDTSKTNLEFNLRQQSHNPFSGMMGGDQRQQHANYGGASRFSLAGNDEVPSMPAVTLYRGTASAGGVNIVA